MCITNRGHRRAPPLSLYSAFRGTGVAHKSTESANEGRKSLCAARPARKVGDERDVDSPQRHVGPGICSTSDVSAGCVTSPFLDVLPDLSASPIGHGRGAECPTGKTAVQEEESHPDQEDKNEQYSAASSKKRCKRKRKPPKPGLTAKNNLRHFVQHNYHDHAAEQDNKEDTKPLRPQTSADEASATRPRRGGVATAFPLKLHKLLDKIEDDGLAHVISWAPHGRSFLIHEPKKFVNEVMPQYFRQTKLTSFQRQLNLYGFQRLTRGADNGAYYHEYFLRGKQFLTKKMVRVRVKGTRFKAASSPDQEPNFYTMPPVGTSRKRTAPVVSTSDDEFSKPASGLNSVCSGEDPFEEINSSSYSCSTICFPGPRLKAPPPHIPLMPHQNLPVSSEAVPTKKYFSSLVRLSPNEEPMSHWMPPSPALLGSPQHPPAISVGPRSLVRGFSPTPSQSYQSVSRGHNPTKDISQLWDSLDPLVPTPAVPNLVGNSACLPEPSALAERSKLSPMVLDQAQDVPNAGPYGSCLSSVPLALSNPETPSPTEEARLTPIPFSHKQFQTASAVEDMDTFDLAIDQLFGISPNALTDAKPAAQEAIDCSMNQEKQKKDHEIEQVIKEVLFNLDDPQFDVKDDADLGRLLEKIVEI